MIPMLPPGDRHWQLIYPNYAPEGGICNSYSSVQAAKIVNYYQNLLK